MPTARTRTPRRRKSSTLSTRPRPLAIGYIRVSTAEQADTGASMDAQRAALTIEAAGRGWDLEIVPEPGLSAKNMKRPALTGHCTGWTTATPTSCSPPPWTGSPAASTTSPG